jgi:hypothetical protein
MHYGSALTCNDAELALDDGRSASGTKYAMIDLMLRHVRVVAALSWLLLLPACTGPGLDHADGQPCALAQMGSLPVVQVGNYYAVDGKINNAPVRLLFDTGSFSTVLTWQAARRVGARSDSTIVAPLAGIGGSPCQILRPRQTARRTFPVH